MEYGSINRDEDETERGRIKVQKLRGGGQGRVHENIGVEYGSRSGDGERERHGIRKQKIGTGGRVRRFKRTCSRKVDRVQQRNGRSAVPAPHPEKMESDCPRNAHGPQTSSRMERSVPANALQRPPENKPPRNAADTATGNARETETAHNRHAPQTSSRMEPGAEKAGAEKTVRTGNPRRSSTRCSST